MRLKGGGGNNLKLKVCSPTSETFERRGVDAGSRVDAERHPEVKVMKLFSFVTDRDRKSKSVCPWQSFEPDNGQILANRNKPGPSFQL